MADSPSVAPAKTEIKWKRCTGPCGERKPLDAFPRHGKARDGHMQICAACCERYGYNSRNKKRQQVAPSPAPSAPPPPQRP